MLPIPLLLGISFLIVGQQIPQCECMCNWWHGGTGSRDSLSYCMATLDTNYKLNIECSVYAIALKALPFLPNGTTGIRVTDTLQSLEPLNTNDTISCLKITSARVNKLSEDDDSLIGRGNKYYLNELTFLPLMAIQLLDVIFEFERDITVGQARFDRQCMELAFEHVKANKTKVNVTECLIQTVMSTELLTPGDNFALNFNIADLFKSDFLTIVLKYLDGIWLQEFNGTINTIALTIQNVFKSIPSEAFQFLANRSVINVILPNNGFERIEQSDLPYLPTLKNLNFSGCSISSIDPKAWDGLINLEVLDLSRNRLQTLPIPHDALPNLKILHLDGQKSLTSPFYFPDFPSSFKQLQSLHISHMKLRNPWTYIGTLTSLEELVIKNAFLREMPQNSSLQSLPDLSILDISDNDFSNEHGLTSILRTVPNLKTLKVAGSGLTCAKIYQFPSIMPQLEMLDLSRNQITVLDHVISAANSEIKYLDLSGNSLKPWSERRFEGTFGTVNLANNIIDDINPVMLQDFDQFESLALTRNNFDCSKCSLIGFQNWMLNTSTILDQKTSPYICSFPIEQIGQDIMDINLRDNASCLPYFFNWLLKVVLPIAMVTIAVVAVGTAVYLNRWHVMYILHLMRAKWRKRFQEEDNRLYRYDAFVSYCSDDRDWILRYLIPKMEKDKPYLHLCVHERDFQVGEPIMNNIIDCIDDSRRSIFILSDKFILSQWCQWELQMAQHKLFEDSRDVLTIIKLGPLDVKILPKVLRHLISTRTYLEWPEKEDAQNAFWARLKGNIGSCRCQYNDQADVRINGVPEDRNEYIQF